MNWLNKIKPMDEAPRQIYSPIPGDMQSAIHSSSAIKVLGYALTLLADGSLPSGSANLIWSGTPLFIGGFFSGMKNSPDNLPSSLHLGQLRRVLLICPLGRMDKGALGLARLQISKVQLHL